jgi:hypothetical protein
MKILLSLLLLLACISSFAQLSLQEVEDTAIVKRIEWVKAKTDSFLLNGFKKEVRPKFQFEFVQGSYLYGEMGFVYVFLNTGKYAPDEINNVTHRYNFTDESIDLATTIDIYFYQDKKVEFRFKSVEDAVKIAALKAIYNEGRLNKIKTKIKEEKLKQPYTTIEIDRTKKFRIFLKDKAGLHAYLIL